MDSLRLQPASPPGEATKAPPRDGLGRLGRRCARASRPATRRVFALAPLSTHLKRNPFVAPTQEADAGWRSPVNLICHGGLGADEAGTALDAKTTTEGAT